LGLGFGLRLGLEQALLAEHEGRSEQGHLVRVRVRVRVGARFRVRV